MFLAIESCHQVLVVNHWARATGWIVLRVPGKPLSQPTTWLNTWYWNFLFDLVEQKVQSSHITCAPGYVWPPCHCPSHTLPTYETHIHITHTQSPVYNKVGIWLKPGNVSHFPTSQSNAWSCWPPNILKTCTLRCVGMPTGKSTKDRTTLSNWN